jgi:ribosomal protein L11 methyltransferase
VPARAWLTENVASFAPFFAGRYFIHGNHVPGPFPAGAWRLTINAATAFGSGEHASTFGCLLSLDGLARRAAVRRKVWTFGALDVGCGTGILALAMARCWPMARCVIAADIDPESVRVARFNSAVNGLRQVRAVLSDGPANRVIGWHRRYAVITANILARPLRAMSKDLSRRLAPGGRLVLAGLLRRQESLVLTAYRAQGLRLEQRILRPPWSILVLRR